jgi:hypothetical protein
LSVRTGLRPWRLLLCSYHSLILKRAAREPPRVPCPRSGRRSLLYCAAFCQLRSVTTDHMRIAISVVGADGTLMNPHSREGGHFGNRDLAAEGVPRGGGGGGHRQEHHVRLVSREFPLVHVHTRLSNPAWRSCVDPRGHRGGLSTPKGISASPPKSMGTSSRHFLSLKFEPTTKSSLQSTRTTERLADALASTASQDVQKNQEAKFCYHRLCVREYINRMIYYN